MKFRTLFVLFVLPLLATACAYAPATDAAAPLEGTVWQLVQLGDAANPAHEPQREPTLRLDAESGRVAGSAGCNRFMGSYTLDGARIDFGQMAATQMACATGMETERAYLQALMQASTWKIEDGRLGFYDAKGERVAQFVASGDAVTP